MQKGYEAGMKKIKERKPIPRPGVRFKDRKKERARKACRKGGW